MATHLSNRTERLSTIEQMLFRSTSGLRAVEIAASCNVDRRTIYRDLSALQELGVPVYQKAGRFFIDREYYLATIRLNLNEAITLLMAVRMLALYQERQNPHIVSILRKLADILPSFPSQHTASIAEATWSNPVDRAYILVLETIIRAWGERRTVKLYTGKSAREVAVYFVEPSPSGELYVVGRDILTQKICVFRLRRIKRAKLLKAAYEIPNHFDPHTYLTKVWGITHQDDSPVDLVKEVEVQLAFSAEAVASFRHQLGRDKSHLERLDEDRYLLRLKVTDWRSMLPWIRSWGAQVEVLAPQPLREQLAADAVHICAVYLPGETPV